MTAAGRALALALLVVAGCTKYAQVATTNAPGDVDLAKPLPHENGAPDRFEKPADPGNEALVVFAIPTFVFGTGREPSSSAVSELGLELRFERHDSDRAWHAPHLAATLGAGFVQLYEGSTGTHAGALYGELDVRFPTAWGVLPVDVGVGPAVYPDTGELGGQISIRAPLMAAHARYMQDNGFEFWVGYQLPIPFIFGRSK